LPSVLFHHLDLHLNNSIPCCLSSYQQVSAIKVGNIPRGLASEGVY
jgi:hypothetical protein